MKKNIDRRTFVRTLGLGSAALALPSFQSCKQQPGLSSKTNRLPNIVFILADDLGYGELGCYGQKKIKTPVIDRLAGGGMRFTQHYSGSPVCAPSRCSLLTGKHTGHAFIRDNDEMSERGDVWHDPALEGQRPIPADTVTIAKLLKKAGYATAAIGKWGLGGPGSPGAPNNQGFDFWYGYLCQRVAHNYYPTHLWKNDKKEALEGNHYFFPHQKLPADRDPSDPGSYADYAGKQYSVDAMVEEALGFICTHRKQPFFLYLPLPLPHVALQVPGDSLSAYAGAFPETPYKGEKGYTPHPQPRAAYAAMISRLDRETGRIIALLEELGIADNTLVIFTSDNGPTYAGGVDAAFFNSAGPLRGLKGSLYEGGIRVPLVAYWPGKIKPGTVCDTVSAFWDFLPTFTQLTGIETPVDTDGLSLLPSLLGEPGKQKEHKYLYWEHEKKMQALRLGDWKGIRLHPSAEIELYNLAKDPGETTDLAPANPGLVARINEMMKYVRTPSQYFPLDGTGDVRKP